MASAPARRAALAAFRTPFMQQSVRNIAGGKQNPFGDHESAVEAHYFNKEDERALMKLLSKVKQASTTGHTATSVAAEAAEEAKLRSILGKYKVSKEDFEAVISWKHEHY